MDPFWKVRMRALEHLKDIYPQYSAEVQHYIQDQIAIRIVNENVHPVAQALEAFKNNETHWIQLMETQLHQVVDKKKQLESDYDDLEEKGRKEIGTQTTFQANVKGKQVDLTPQQQLILLELALQEQNISTEAMKIDYFATN